MTIPENSSVQIPPDQNQRKEKSSSEKIRALQLLGGLGGILLILVGIYLWLHLTNRFGDSYRTQVKVLEEIVQATDVLDDKLILESAKTQARLRSIIPNTNGEKPINTADNLFNALNQMTEKNKAPNGDTLITATSSEIDKLLKSNIPDTAKIGKTTVRDSVSKALKALSDEKKKALIGTLFPKIKVALRKFWADSILATNRAWIGLEQVMNSTDLDLQTVRKLLIQLQDEIRPTQNYFFWSSGYWRWAELTFWSFFGTLLYLLVEVYTNYPPEENKKKSFLAYTPWYLITAIKGPFIALAVMFGLMTVSIQVSTISLSLDKARIELLIFLALILGYYNRVAKEQLDILVEKIFPNAWKRATAPSITLRTNEKEVTLGGKIKFEIEPDQNVTWELEPDEAGSIKQDGTYTAPDDEKYIGTMVTIKATSVRDPGRSATETITIKGKQPE